MAKDRALSMVNFGSPKTLSKVKIEQVLFWLGSHRLEGCSLCSPGNIIQLELLLHHQWQVKPTFVVRKLLGGVSFVP